MSNTEQKIYIIGAGVSGLIAASVLEKNGLKSIIIEASDRVGGRVKTDIIHGYQLDRGFQVLLTNYEYAKKYLDYTKLELQKIKAGSLIYSQGRIETIGDPLRDIKFLAPTLLSLVGTFKDKFKIASLNLKLKNKTIEEIFSAKEQTTLDYLHKYGFSDKIINQFFIPFFSGIFLESKLSTSSRMFEFVFKMFGEGYAAIPKNGMEEIPLQLKRKLKDSIFKFNSKVISVNSNDIILENGKKLIYDYVIVTAEPNQIIPNLKGQKISWKSSQTLYFTSSVKSIKQPIIGLLAEKETLSNNVFIHTNLDTFIRKQRELISVTVVKEHKLTKTQLIEKVKAELEKHCLMKDLSFLEMYDISKSLPVISNIQYSIAPSETKLNDKIFLAGDNILNASLNASMISGEKAALGILEVIQKKLIRKL